MAAANTMAYGSAPAGVANPRVNNEEPDSRSARSTLSWVNGTSSSA